MNKSFKILFVSIALIVVILLFKIAGPSAKKPADGFLYVKTGTQLPALKKQLLDEKILGSLFWFQITEKFLPFDKVKPGKYEVPQSMSVLNLLRMLRNGSQTPVNLVITRLRTKEQLASKLGASFEFDSAMAIGFLNSNDSLKKYELDTNSVMAAVLPLTYEIKWNTDPRRVFDKFYDAYHIFWTDERKQKAQGKGLTVLQAITLASIVDEETNATKEKGMIASTYLNRLNKGMRLQADPTVKYALKDFSIKRVLLKHLSVPSPYNTYKNTGLPPGPICTPQEATIDAVLSAPDSDYLYFVASPKFDGTHVFSNSYDDHLQKAKKYQQALNKRLEKIPAATQ